ncbi:MAG: hypothetical protein LBD79_09380 [Treponema sp.]|nr:hypothetical protein [Treponema sp.]
MRRASDDAYETGVPAHSLAGFLHLLESAYCGRIGFSVLITWTSGVTIWKISHYGISA